MTVIDSSHPSYINYTTEKRLSTVALLVEDINKIIQNIDSNKSHGDDNISICMLKLCGVSIYKLFLLGCFCLNRGKEVLFPFTKKVTRKILKIVVQSP